MTDIDDRPGNEADGPVTAPPPPPGGYFPAPPAPTQTSESTRQWVSLTLLLLALGWLTWHFGPWGLLVVVGLVVMIFLHELGHYVMAKRAGMKVTEFFLGFGPRLWSFRRGETEYGIKAIPAGAYVKIIGMNNLDEVAPADEPRAYRQKSLGARLGVAVAGSFMHFVQALILIFVLLSVVGVQGGSLVGSPNPSGKWVVASVSGDSAAQRAGLHQGDTIKTVDGASVASYDALRTAVKDKPEQPVDIVFEHGGVTKTAHVILGHQPDDPSTGLLGITAEPPTERVGVASAIPQTFRDFGSVSKQSVLGLWHVFSPSGFTSLYHQVTNTARDQQQGAAVVGPSNGQHSSSGASSTSSDDANRPLSILGVFRLGASAGQSEGIAAVLVLFVLINIFIGIFNLVPLLPFDGGHVMVACYEKIQEVRRQERRRYFADVSRLLPVTYVVVLVLVGLFAATTYLDIARPLTVK